MSFRLNNLHAFATRFTKGLIRLEMDFEVKLPVPFRKRFAIYPQMISFVSLLRTT